MPPKKGKPNRRPGKNKNSGARPKRELQFREEGQEYAQVTKILGNCRVECMCSDGISRLGTIRGKMRRRVWVQAFDIVLVGLRDFEDAKCDIIGKYTLDEVRRLKAHGAIEKHIQVNEADYTGTATYEDNVEFGSDGNDEGSAESGDDDEDDDKESVGSKGDDESDEDEDWLQNSVMRFSKKKIDELNIDDI